jgi:hypothetical protein
MQRRIHPAHWLVALAVGVSVVLGAKTTRADDGEMDPVLEATLHLKVQSYDHKLATRIKKRFVVAVLYQPGSPACEALAHRMADAFARVAEKYRIKTLKPTIVMIAADQKLVESLQAAESSMIYVTSGLEDALPRIVAAGIEVRALTVTRVREHVTAGVGIGIVVDHHKPKMIVNLPSVVASGVELDAEMLGLAEVLR